MLKSMAHRFSLRSRLVGLGMRLNWGFFQYREGVCTSAQYTDTVRF
jgi:hypothetical protein